MGNLADSELRRSSTPPGFPSIVPSEYEEVSKPPSVLFPAIQAIGIARHRIRTDHVNCMVARFLNLLLLVQRIKIMHQERQTGDSRNFSY